MKRLFFLAPFLLLTSLLAQPPDQAWQLRFEGNDDITLPLNPLLDVGSTYSFQVWLYPERATLFTRILEKGIPNRSSDPGFALVLGIDSQGRVAYSQTTGLPGSSRGVTSAAALPLNTWSHVAVTSNKSSIILYINGAEAGRFNATGAIPVNNLPLSLGAEVNSSTYECCGFAGFLRQFSIWNRALAPAEINSGMKNVLTGLESGLVGFWPLDDGQGYTLRDAGPMKLNAGFGYQGANVTQLNGVTTRAQQVQPYWVRPQPASANPFDWSAQPQTSHVLTEAQRMYSIDFDNDGDTDVVVADFFNPGLSSAPMKAYRNDGKGHFTDATSQVFGSLPPAPLTASRGVVADFNGDGRADLFVGDFGPDFPVPPAESGGQNRILIQTPDGRLVDETSTRLPIAKDLAHDAAGADIDGDGKTDLIFAGVFAPYKVKLMMNDGSGHFAIDNSRLPDDVLNKRALVTRFFDANGDGKPDLFLGLEESTGSTTDLLLLNDGTGRFRNMISGALPARAGGMNCATVGGGVGDLNGDGKPDLLLTTFCDHYAEGGFQILINRGDGTFEDRTSQWLPDGLILPSPIYSDAFPWLRTVLFADFNGDGKLDVIIQNLGSGRNRLYFNTGTRLMEAPEFLPAMEGTVVGGGPDIAVADFDRDGRPDIFTMDQTSNRPGNVDTIYVGLSKRSFSPSVALLPPAPQILRMNIVNEASLSADVLAPGTRVRIRANGLGPAVPVVFNEAPGAVPPTTLGGVTMTFDSIQAQLLAVSATEITAIVPLATAGKWLASVQVAYGSTVSLPVTVPITDGNPQVYGTRTADGKSIATVWRIVNGVRTPLSGLLNWGERIAFRVTGAGQGKSPLVDGATVAEKSFSPLFPFSVATDSTGGAMNIVSMTWAPEGLSGVVEVVVDLPAQSPPSGPGIFLSNAKAFQSAWNTWLPVSGSSVNTGTCAWSVTPSTLTFSGAGSTQIISVTTSSGCSWSAVPAQTWTAFLTSPAGTGTGKVSVSAPSNTDPAARTGTITIAGQRIAVTQAGLPASAPSIAGIFPIFSTTATIQPGSWVSIYGSNLSSGTTVWNGAPTASGTNPTALGDVSAVTFNGKPGYLWLVSPGQINVQAPDGTLAGTVIVTLTNSLGSAASTVTLAPLAPSLSLLDNKHVAGVILTPDGSGAYGGGTYDLVGPVGAFPYKTRPVKAGEYLLFYGVGFGPTNPSVPAGKPYGGTAAAMDYAVIFTIGNIPVTPAFAGMISPGLYQFNLLVPPGTGSGEKSVAAKVAGVSTPSTVVIDIH